MHTYAYTITTASLYSISISIMANPVKPKLYIINLIANFILSIMKSITMLYFLSQLKYCLCTQSVNSAFRCQ